MAVILCAFCECPAIVRCSSCKRYCCGRHSRLICLPLCAEEQHRAVYVYCVRCLGLSDAVMCYTACYNRLHPKEHPMTSKRGPVAGTEEAKRGGQAVREKYGHDFYARIGKKGGETVKQRGPAFFAEIGRKGGETTRRSHGVAFYSRIGKAGGEATRRGRTKQPSA